MLDYFFTVEETENIIPLKQYKVIHCRRSTIESFISKWHYSGSINGCISDYCFALVRGDEVVGALFYGRLAMVNQWKRFADCKEDVIELRRLCCIDDTPKNTESYFIGKSLKWLQQNTNFKIVVSYADAEYGHTGTVYKASNFEYLGLSKGAKIIVKDNKRFHDKSVRTYHNGILKPFAQKLKDSLEDGTAHYKLTKGKHTYIYKLRKR